MTARMKVILTRGRNTHQDNNNLKHWITTDRIDLVIQLPPPWSWSVRPDGNVLINTDEIQFMVPRKSILMSGCGSEGRAVGGHWFDPRPLLSTCQSVLGKDTESQIPPVTVCV